MSLSSDFMCWCGLQTIYNFLNCVDRPSKTGVMINIVRHMFSLTFPSRLVQEEAIKTGCSRESVRKQEVFASKKTCSFCWKKAPHQPITKLYDKSCDLVAEERGKLCEGR